MRSNFLPFFYFLSFFLREAPICAQINLVVNPSFEDTLSCPNNISQINKASGWQAYNGDPEYFNSCASGSSQVSTPFNFGGYQQAASGTAYAGMITYGGVLACGWQNTCRDFIGGDLTTPLSIGTKYYISFLVSLPIKSSSNLNFASNNIGVNFSTVPYVSPNYLSVTNSSVLYSSSIITDSANWTRVSGTFVADSSYNYVILGNFFDDSNTDTLIMDGSNNYLYAYYYLDDVCVSTDSLTCNGPVGIETYHVSQENFKIYPNPVQDIVYLEINLKNDESGFVLLYDVLGNQIDSKRLSEGFNKVAFDLTNLCGAVYVYRLVISGEIRSNKKLIITK